MMGHELHRSGRFWSFHLSIDKDLADSARQQGCSCRGSRYNMMLSSGGGSRNAGKKGVQKNFVWRGSSGSGRVWRARKAETARCTCSWCRSEVEMTIGSPRWGRSAGRMTLETSRWTLIGLILSQVAASDCVSQPEVSFNAASKPAIPARCR